MDPLGFVRSDQQAPGPITGFSTFIGRREFTSGTVCSTYLTACSHLDFLATRSSTSGPTVTASQWKLITSSNKS